MNPVSTYLQRYLHLHYLYYLHLFLLDINECMVPGEYLCPDGMVCKNVEGWYDCVCPPGTTMKNLTDCVRESTTLIIFLDSIHSYLHG